MGSVGRLSERHQHLTDSGMAVRLQVFLLVSKDDGHAFAARSYLHRVIACEAGEQGDCCRSHPALRTY